MAASTAPSTSSATARCGCCSRPATHAGHQSVLLRLAGRDLLLTGDAVYTQRTIDEGLVPIYCADQHLYRRSLGEIQGNVASHPGDLVICGHDAEQWPQLQPVYI